MLVATLTTSCSLSVSGGAGSCGCDCGSVGCCSSGRVFFFCGACGGVRRDCASAAGRPGMKADARRIDASTAEARRRAELVLMIKTSRVGKAGGACSLRLKNIRPARADGQTKKGPEL